VVPPPPSVQGGGTGTGRISSLGSGGSAVVPPPPSMQGAGGTGARNGVGSTLAGGGQVVPPPPSLSGTGSGPGTGGGNGGRGHSLSAGGAQVVPPPPSVGGDGNGSGMGRSAHSSLGGPGQVVPPPPGISGAGGGNRAGTLMAGGTGVVAPPPSVEGMGNGGGGNGGGVPGGDLRAAPPGNGAGSVSTGPLEQMDPLDSPQEQAKPIPNTPAEDLPLRLVGVAVASSKTSFFSNYEVFVAERRVGQGQMELIKLVYTFLPYQKRLSEYDLNTTKVYKLRAVRDPGCDETLMSMTWPEGEQPDPDTQDAVSTLASNASNKNSRLPCFRTTADDFVKAITKGP